MEKPYKFRDLKAASEMPADTNEYLIEFARAALGANAASIISAVMMIQGKRLYGNLVVRDSIGSIVMHAPFQAGISKTAHLDMPMGNPFKLPLVIRFERSAINSNVRMGKDHEM